MKDEQKISYTFIMFKKLNIITFIMFIGIILSISATPMTQISEINNIVQFENETETIGITQTANLDAVVKQLNQHPSVPIIITGHYSDDYGNDRMDYLSALKRAGETREYLQKQGVKNDIVVYVDMNSNQLNKNIVTFKWITEIQN